MRRLFSGSNTALLFWFCLSFVAFPSAQAQKATVTETYQNIPTYGFDDPDPIAIPYKRADLYPYYRFDGFSDTAEPREWKVLTLENKHIRVMILPEQGGKIWGAIDKKSGFDFIYRNDVVKFRDIALRGPWTSGGIEFNFGLIGHTPSTATPVDYACNEHSDGSASCTVGATDWASGTKWRVTIHLAAENAYFTTRSFWYNPTPLRHSYYHWMNAAMHDGDSLRFYIPGRYYIGHGGELHSWPVNDDGVDMSWYRNHTGAYYSHHVLGETRGGYALYWHDRGLGAGHYNPRRDLPGQKIWTWGLAGAGAIWEDLLTDTNGQYIEAQSGRLYNQAAIESGLQSPFTQTSFGPFVTDTWEDIWFPIGSIGGVTEISQSAVLNIKRTTDTLEVDIFSLEPVNDSVFVYLGDSRVFAGHISQDANQVWRRSIPVDHTTGSVRLLNGAGSLHYNEQSEDVQWNRPLTRPAGYDEESADGFYRRGLEFESIRQFAEAEKMYRMALERESYHVESLVHLGSMALRQGRNQNASAFARKALSISGYHPEANLIVGTAAIAMDNLADAREALTWAARDPGLRSAARVLLAEMMLAAGRLQEAAIEAESALLSNAQNLRAMELLAIIARLKGEMNRWGHWIRRIEELDPISHFALFERLVVAEDESGVERFRSSNQSEWPHQVLMSLAHDYIKIDRIDEADTALRMADQLPLVLLTRGYLARETNPELSFQMLRRAEASDPAFVFPFRAASIPVLTWAASRSDGWKPGFFLGLLYRGLGRDREALGVLDALESGPDHYAFYLNRSVIRRESGNDSGAESDLKTAIQINPDEWRGWHLLQDMYREQGGFDAAVEITTQAYERFPSIGQLVLDHTRALLNQGRFNELLQVFDDVNISPFEGFAEAHQIYERALIYLAVEAMEREQYATAENLLARSMEYPRALGVGEPADPDWTVQLFLRHVMATKTGDSETAALLRADLEARVARGEAGPYAEFLAAAAMLDAGATAAAERWLKTGLEDIEENDHNWITSLVQNGSVQQGYPINERFSPKTVLRNVLGLRRR